MKYQDKIKAADLCTGKAAYRNSYEAQNDNENSLHCKLQLLKLIAKGILATDYSRADLPEHLRKEGTLNHGSYCTMLLNVVNDLEKEVTVNEGTLT